MSTEPKLETYLALMDKALGPIPVSDRSDIITEIKAHILDAQEKEPNRSLASILSSLGEPESVANRYLMERGLKPGKPSRSPMVKWLTIGFLGTLGIGALTAIILVWKVTAIFTSGGALSPLVSIDGDNVKLLGGAIDIGSGDTVEHKTNLQANLKIGNKNWSKHSFEGVSLLNPTQTTQLRIPFDNASLQIESTQDNQVEWKCRARSGAENIAVEKKAKIATLDLTSVSEGECHIKLPPQIKSVITGMNGTIDLNKPRAELEVTLDNGTVMIEPAKDMQYAFDLNANSGMIDTFLKTTNGGIPVKVLVKNGTIKRRD